LRAVSPWGGILMNRTPSVRTVRAVALLAGLLLSAPAWSQQQPGPAPSGPRVLLVTPAGGQAGTAVEVAVTGYDLDNAETLLFSDSRIKAELVGSVTNADAKTNPPKGPQGSGPTQTARFKVSVPAGTPTGTLDVRVVSKSGVSNPRAFVVGDLPETVEKEPNNDVAEAQRVEINSVVHGVIAAPTDVDYYLFAGKKGQRVVVHCAASTIDSKLTPAVQLYGKNGLYLAHNRDYRGSDAVLDAVLPEDGDYYVRVFAFTYTQGGPEHFYRLQVSTAPWIDAVFPPVVEAGKETQVTVYGRNLPGGQPDPTAVFEGRVLEKITLTVRPPAAAEGRLDFPGFVPPPASGLDGFALRLRNDTGSSNPYLLTVAQAPVILDNGDNDTPEKAQSVPVPCEIAGRIERARDRDWYRFEARKGEVLSIEVYGDRLGTTADFYFTLRAAGAKTPLVEMDDNPEVLHPTQFFSRTEDPARYKFEAPADGPYLLQVSSREADVQGGPRHLYRVRITAPRPDFRLVVMPPSATLPDAVTLQRGSSCYYTVFAWRQDGYEGPIRLTAEGLPPGVTCPPQTLAAGQKQGVLVLSADDSAGPWTGHVVVKGTAAINGRELVREVRPATITWATQANVPAVARLDVGMSLAVRDEPAPFRLSATFDKEGAQAGDKVTVKVKLERLSPDVKGTVAVTALTVPAGQGGNPAANAPAVFNNGQPLTLAAGRDEATATLDLRANMPPGPFTLVLRGTTTATVKDAQGRPRPNVALTQASAPATLRVAPKQVAELKLTPQNVTVKSGGEVEVTVKVNRLYGFDGPLQVQLMLPDGSKGVTAEEVTIPADRDEAKLVIRAAAGTPQGQRNGAAVRASATYENQPTVQEAKLTLNVVR
jgi:hypothetical protein